NDRDGAYDEVSRGEKARAVYEWDIVHPLVDTGEEAKDAKDPERRLSELGLCNKISDQGKAEQQQESDMHGPHNLAGQCAVGSRPQLEQREGERDPERRLAEDTFTETGRQTFDRLLSSLLR